MSQRPPRHNRTPSAPSVPDLTSGGTGSQYSATQTPPRPQGMMSPAAGVPQQYQPQFPGSTPPARQFTASELDRSSSVDTPPGVARGQMPGQPSVSPTFLTTQQRPPINRSSDAPPSWGSVPSGGSGSPQSLRMQPPPPRRSPTEADVKSELLSNEGLRQKVFQSYDGKMAEFYKLSTPDKVSVLTANGCTAFGTSARMPSSPPIARPSTAGSATSRMSMQSGGSTSTTNADIEKALLESPSTQRYIENNFTLTRVTNNADGTKSTRKLTGLAGFNTMAPNQRMAYLDNLSRQNKKNESDDQAASEDEGDDDEPDDNDDDDDEAEDSGAGSPAPAESSSEDEGPSSPTLRVSTHQGQRNSGSQWGNIQFSQRGRGGSSSGGVSSYRGGRGGYR